MCKYCKEGELLRDELGYLTTIKIVENKLQIEYDAYSCDSSFQTEIEIKYCMMCGKKLIPLNICICIHCGGELIEVNGAWYHHSQFENGKLISPDNPQDCVNH